MKRYRLEAMIKIRKQEKRRQEIALAKALSSLQEAKKKLEKLKEEKEKLVLEQKEAHREMSDKMRSGGLIGIGCFHANFLRRLKEDEEKKTEEIVSQTQVHQEAKELVAKTRARYIEAIKQLRMMEKHKALWMQKLRLENIRKEEKKTDELGQTMHQLRKWREEDSLFEVSEK